MAKRASANRDIILIKKQRKYDSKPYFLFFYFLLPSAIIRAPTAAVAAVPAHMPYLSFSLSSASFMYRIIEIGVLLNRSKYVTVLVLYSNGLASSSSKIRTPRGMVIGLGISVVTALILIAVAVILKKRKKHQPQPVAVASGSVVPETASMETPEIGNYSAEETSETSIDKPESTESDETE